MLLYPLVDPAPDPRSSRPASTSSPRPGESLPRATAWRRSSGRRAGGPRIPWNREKTVAGSLALRGCAAAPPASFLAWWCRPAVDAPPDLWFSIVRAVVAAAARGAGRNDSDQAGRQPVRRRSPPRACSGRLSLDQRGSRSAGVAPTWSTAAARRARSTLVVASAGHRARDRVDVRSDRRRGDRRGDLRRHGLGRDGRC